MDLDRPAPGRPRGLVLASVVAGCAVALGVTGCAGPQLGVSAGAAPQASQASISLAPGSHGAVKPSQPLVVRVSSGRLTDVVVTGPAGSAVTGSLSTDGSVWTSQQGVLDYGAQYDVSATAVDRSGLPTRFEDIVRTVAPSTYLGFTVAPQGEKVGVGMPITMSLDRALATADSKAAFERTLVVRVNGTPVVGAWRWSTDRVLVYRPQTYWRANSTVTVDADVKGVRFFRGLWGEKDVRFSFTTGDAMIDYVDMRTHQLRVTRNGKTLRVIPITTGKPGFETRSGVKVIMTKERTRIMDAATGGTAKTDPEYYRLQVEYAMRVTDTGEFLHAAPWSVGAQGYANVSHGCTGMSTSNARWFYDRSRIGDVVVYTGTSRSLEPGNGITVWNTSWKHWRSGSALV